MSWFIFTWITTSWAAKTAAFYAPSPLKKILKWFHALSFEFFTFLLLIALRITSLFERKTERAKGNGKPILLVHGYLNAGFVWKYVKRALEKRGFGPVYTVNLGYPFHSIRDYANTVSLAIERIEQENGRGKVTLIGHSMGGLVSALYALKTARKGSVAKVIAIASPLQGTAMARLGIGRCAREMQRDSQFVLELGALMQQSEIPLYTIATKTDQLVVPYTSSLTGARKRQYLLDDIGHASLLFSPRVTEQLCLWLA